MLTIEERRLTSWREITDAADYLAGHSWVFRGHERAEWTLETTLEREFGKDLDVEQQMLWHFVRRAPRLLSSHLVPTDGDTAAWLGLIQHYGGPTRLLDVTRSPYVALFFAYESFGDSDRALWAIDYGWCMSECARMIARAERIAHGEAFERVSAAQAQLVFSLVHRQPFPDARLVSFQQFTGVFPLDPWKPDARQSAQQGMFLCKANLQLTFIANLSIYESAAKPVYQFVLPAALRSEVLERLAVMNVTAATLFPDLTGLARSLRTHTVRYTKSRGGQPPWDKE
jgi:hypothetical protein